MSILNEEQVQTLEQALKTAIPTDFAYVLILTPANIPAKRMQVFGNIQVADLMLFLERAMLTIKNEVFGVDFISPNETTLPQ